jgi:UDP-glucose 4-epimerase
VNRAAFSRRMKILVVGGAGYIGSICTELLLDEGHEAAVFDNLGEGHRRAVDSRAKFIEGDLADREKIHAALSSIRPDAVMHFAASALVGESMRDPSKYFRKTFQWFELLIMRQRGRRIAFPRRARFRSPERVPTMKLRRCPNQSVR